MASRGRAFRNYQVAGFEILVGKGDADNDRLTFGVGEPLDFWLHVAGVPGSHVLVRNPDGVSSLPHAVLERAAELAAWHSKARNARGKVEVHVCRIADLRKPRGAPAGQVQLERWERLRVYPRDLVAAAAGKPASDAADGGAGHPTDPTSAVGATSRPARPRPR